MIIIEGLHGLNEDLTSSIERNKKYKIYISPLTQLNIDKHNRPGSDRGRFTLAHELGHYFIDAHRIGLKNGLLEPHPSLTNRKQFTTIEREADYFASCLLLNKRQKLLRWGSASFRLSTWEKSFGDFLLDWFWL